MNTKQIENISKALADETRLWIFVAITAKDDMTSGDLARLRGVTPATISHHLRILKQAHLIECRKEGQFVHSRAIAETIAQHAETLALLSKRVSAPRNPRKR
jgi:DNA-binding transcriptional ArsR family regulator